MTVWRALWDGKPNLPKFAIKLQILWEKVIYPVLGILLAAREPLHRQHLAQLLGVQDYRCREGLMKLGGLVIVDGQQKCSLFHLKFRDYLRQDEQFPEKEYLFS